MSQENQSSQSRHYKIFFRHRHTMVELSFRNGSRKVEEVIRESLKRLADEYFINLRGSEGKFSLWVADKAGRRLSGSPEVEHSQKLKSVGVRRFVLQSGSDIRESISTEINLERKYGFEKKIEKRPKGCCGMFGGV